MKVGRLFDSGKWYLNNALPCRLHLHSFGIKLFIDLRSKKSISGKQAVARQW
jgi:hypothetical protein